jgi:hypothetical protein
MTLILKSISKSVNDASPYQRDEVMAAYSGHEIKWKLEYHSITKKGANFGHIMAREPNGYPWVFFDIDLSLYPQFKIMREGEKFTIMATIESVTAAHDVNLKNIKGIEFFEGDGQKRFLGSEEKPGSRINFIERITNNQTIAIVFGTLILLIILYSFYKLSGIDLSKFT